MSLRTRLFLGVGSLVALLVVAQAFWVRRLADELSDEVDHVAVEVSHSLISHFMVAAAGECPAEQICESEDVFVHHGEPPPGTKVVERKMRVVAVRQGEADDAPVEGHPSDPADVLVHAPPGSQAFVHRSTDDDGSYKIEVRVENHDPDAEPSEHQWRWMRKQDEEQRVLELHGPDHFVRKIPIPLGGLREKLEHLQGQLLWSSAGFLGVGLLLAALVAQRVSSPLRRLSAAARDVGEGALGTQVPATAPGEVGAALAAFNRMSSELEDLDRKNRELRAQRHLGEIGELARGLAHTLRNPLNALGLSVEELAGRADDEAADLAAAARRQIRRLDASIRSFLVLASQGVGASADVDVGELVRDVALEALHDGSNAVRLDVEADDALPALHAVEPELRAVLQALLVNAVEASPRGGEVTIRVAATEAAGHVRVEIDDAGPGLPPEVRERLFTPHVTTKANGSGMGLFLAHRIATARYGGRLELEDREPHGTRVVLELGPRLEPRHEEEDDV